MSEPEMPAEARRERSENCRPLHVFEQLRRAIECIENGKASVARDVLLTLASSLVLKDPSEWTEQERAEVQRLGEEVARRIREGG